MKPLGHRRARSRQDCSSVASQRFAVTSRPRPRTRNASSQKRAERRRPACWRRRREPSGDLRCERRTPSAGHTPGEGTLREHQRRNARPRPLNRCRPIPRACGISLVSVTRACARLPPRCSMARRGSRFESVRGLCKAPQKGVSSFRFHLRGPTACGGYGALLWSLQVGYEAPFASFLPAHHSIKRILGLGASARASLPLGYVALAVRGPGLDDGDAVRAVAGRDGGRHSERARIDDRQCARPLVCHVKGIARGP
jgi:hypothetical protein